MSIKFKLAIIGLLAAFGLLHFFAGGLLDGRPNNAKSDAEIAAANRD
jgi:hypothetical protein